MTNRPLSFIVKDQKPAKLSSTCTVRDACRLMYERAVGSVLVMDGQGRLKGIFTGRDAVRLLAKGNDASGVSLAKAMTRNPVTIGPEARAIDAICAMCSGGFLHLPVVDGGKVVGIVTRNDFKGMEIEEYAWRKICQVAASPENRELAEIIEGQKPLLLTVDQTVQQACRSMWKRKLGSALVVDGRQRLKGIFTGRDAVRVLAVAKNASAMRLAKAMTRNPVTTTRKARAIDALRIMNDGGFRHLPVVENGSILGVLSRSDFTGIEIDRLDEEEHLKECIW